MYTFKVNLYFPKIYDNLLNSRFIQRNGHKKALTNPLKAVQLISWCMFLLHIIILLE